MAGGVWLTKITSVEAWKKRLVRTPGMIGRFHGANSWPEQVRWWGRRHWQGAAWRRAVFIDPRNGRTVNNNLAEYHVPVNADIGEIDVSVVGIPDTKFNPLGGRGIGEIGITGAGAAIANAIYNATGKRIRSAPITPDMLIG